jgi:hypothetical protein
MNVFRSVEDVVAVLGQELGPTDWLELSQDQVGAFADLTGDSHRCLGFLGRPPDNHALRHVRGAGGKAGLCG